MYPYAPVAQHKDGRYGWDPIQESASVGETAQERDLGQHVGQLDAGSNNPHLRQVGGSRVARVRVDQMVDFSWHPRASGVGSGRW